MSKLVLGIKFSNFNILTLHVESYFCHVSVPMCVTQIHQSKVILFVKCVFVSMLPWRSFIILAFQRSTTMGADTVFVLKQFVIWKRRGNDVLLPEMDVLRCADKLREQCNLTRS